MGQKGGQIERMLKALGFVLIPESWGRVYRILRICLSLMLHLMSHEGLAERSEHGRPIICKHDARPMQSKNDHDTKEEYRGWSISNSVHARSSSAQLIDIKITKAID